MGAAWLTAWHPVPALRPVLLCLPPAGAGCGQFQSWQTELGDGVSVVGVQLPGREGRWADPEPDSVDDAVDAVVSELAELVPSRHPVVVFGHSFGGLLGYEIARSLAREHGWWPRALVVAACRPPGMWIGAGRGLVEDDDELTRLFDARGLSAEDVDEDTRELMLGVLRQDARLSLTYPGTAPRAVDCALEAWGGEHDEIVSAEHLTGWGGYAGGQFRTRTFPGGHYFCLTEPAAALELLGPMVTEPAGNSYGRTR